MNDLDDMEKKLRSWIPRGPSARLRQKLFRRDARSMSSGILFGECLVVRVLKTYNALLVPAAGCLVLGFVLLNGPTFWRPFARSVAADSLLASAIFSNQDLAFATGRGHPVKRNGLPKRTFEWTNSERSSSTFQSLPAWITNSLAR